jgi:hypothetical protein
VNLDKVAIWTAAAVLGTFVVAARPVEAQIPSPAGVYTACIRLDGEAEKLVRLVAPNEPCQRREQRVTWNAAGAEGPEGPAGPQGPAGPRGLPGVNAPGVTGGADRGPVGTPDSPPQPAFLSSTPTSLTTDNKATGFSGYMVWANVSLQFNSGNPAQGTGPSPSNAGCQIVYSVDERPGQTYFVDGRSVQFPVFAFGQNDRVVQLTVGLTGMIGQELSPPLLSSETVNVSLNCTSPGPTPPSGPIPVPVKATSWSLTGIGLNAAF